MYGGDEVSAIVMDVGTHSVKAGYAGQDTPSAVFSSSVGRGTGQLGGPSKDSDAEMKDADDPHDMKPKSIQNTNIFRKSPQDKDFFVVDSDNIRRDDVEYCSPFNADGVLDDLDAYEAICDHVFRGRLCVQTAEHPILLSEPVLTPEANREKIVELLFEKYKLPAVFLGKNPVLSCFASGKATGLSVDVGGRAATTCAVHEGYALVKSVIQSKALGGDCLTETTLRYMEEKMKNEVKPRYAFKKKLQTGGKNDGEFKIENLSFPKTSKSYNLLKRHQIAEDAKASVMRLSDVRLDLKNSEINQMPTVQYELPDGNTIEVGVERFIVPEIMFNPAIVDELKLKGPPVVDDMQNAMSLPAQVLASIQNADVDARKDLFGNVILTGGGTMFVNCKERLESAIFDHAPQNVKTKVTASQNAVERRFATWIGGSILASLGSFQQMWMSKAEYDEYGVSHIHKKCP
ncbi:unknown [Bathycoccus prasinos]|uniref:Actin-related protein 4 n=1 Tax=Bathycoccus prasinos TaxID=41875 RepID=K8EG91_9CHLO|nr:unknown [Bathycoccus prasinos]CCO16984.1 unknown [Bathycoccus prasinos]|mmetsp:Transcript_4685/g.15154  ORF Transcript_4685/g.15154 Transcript_4685/m.15154 type:complete len:460 (+) Transcript_4685:244-1623(+)|eukprot:XP_007512384.1 unknown [Bathycoccus prasinos]